MKFHDDISNMNMYVRTYIHTYIHTDKPKPICPLLFQSWGHNEGARVATRYVDFSGARGQITPKSVVGSGINSNSFKFLCMCLLPARMKKIQ